MNITLFGGSFNPPHLGHLIVIEQAFELIKNIDELWILPAYRHTFQKDLVPSQHRLAMTKLLMSEISQENKNNTKLCAVEFEYKLSGETYEALKLLKQKYTDHQFSFLMGTDQIKSFEKWGSWKNLLEEMHFYLYPRSGYKNDIRFPNMSLLESEIQAVTNISSTMLRNRIQNQMPISHLLPDSVFQYTKVNRLYSQKP